VRVSNGRVSNSIKLFKKEYLSKFKLLDCYDIFRPVVFFGMYDDADYKAFSQYNSKIIVVWCGSDTMFINPERAKILKTKDATHIVKSEFMSADLNKYKIPHKILPISWQRFNLTAVPRGHRIFHYGIGKAYGIQYIPEIEKRTGFEVVVTNATMYSKERLYEIYKSCFIGLRLTLHDGLPNTVIELGMMGRRCLYNGGIPNAIKWNGINDIVHSILSEYKNREISDEDDVEKAVKNYINIGEEWLNV